MAKDITMKKGNEEIIITQDYLEHFKKLGYKTNEKNATRKKEVIQQDEQKEV